MSSASPRIDFGAWTPLWRDRPRFLMTVALAPRLNQAIASDPGMAGLAVLAVPSAKSALGLLGQRQVDAFAVSGSIPDMDLAELVCGIRASHSNPRALVLAVVDTATAAAEASAALVDQVVLGSWFSQATARDIGVCIEVAHARRSPQPVCPETP